MPQAEGLERALQRELATDVEAEDIFRGFARVVRQSNESPFVVTVARESDPAPGVGAVRFVVGGWIADASNRESLSVARYVSSESGQEHALWFGRIHPRAYIEGHAFSSYNDEYFDHGVSGKIFVARSEHGMDAFVQTRASAPEVAEYLTAVGSCDAATLDRILSAGRVDPERCARLEPEHLVSQVIVACAHEAMRGGRAPNILSALDVALGARADAAAWNGPHGENFLHLLVERSVGAATSIMPGAIDRLVRAGVNIDGRDDFGRTPLVVAVEFGSVEAVRTLIGMGADIELADSKGATPSDVAATSGSDEIKALLQSALARAAVATVVQSEVPRSCAGPG